VRLWTVISGWVAELPALLDADGRPFDRERVFPYAFRHTYAQRHADAGTPIVVLQALMDHDNIATTQGYFRIGAKAKREAVRTVRGLQLDLDGQRVVPVVEELVQSEQLRREVGQVATPLGMCTEPHNVKALGQACPYRMRCLGCTHFRTDPSYRDQLQHYLEQLLDTRERLRAAGGDVAPWAARDAEPADEEIAAVRRLISRCDELLGELGPEQRRSFEQAARLARGARQQARADLPTSMRLAVTQVAPQLRPRSADE
jgi:hypothetical protein